MTYALRKKHQLSLNYNRRVNRPNFRDLSPAVEVNDPCLYERGNPELKPDFTNTIELGWLYQNLYSLHLFHSLIKDAISKSYHLDPYGRTVVQPMTSLLIALMLSTSLASQVPFPGRELTALVSKIATDSAAGMAAFAVAAALYVASGLLIAWAGAVIEKKLRILR